MSEPTTQDLTEQQALFLKLLCRHLVSITGDMMIDRGNGAPLEQRFVSYSGFLISVYDVWILVTAGHILEELDRGMKKNQITFARCELVDYYGLGATTEYGIPFNIADATKWHIDNDKLGVDIGLIQLSQHDRRLLERNSVVAIPQENWQVHDRLEFESFGILGLPEEKLDGNRRVTACGEMIAGGMRPVLMTGNASDAVPSHKPEPISPWLAVELRDKHEIQSMKGMSGGPILGFMRGPNNKLLYTVVAVQSWWDKERRIAFGTRLPPLMALFYKTLESHIGGQSEQEEGE